MKNLFLVAAIVIVSMVNAQTVVSTNIASNTTWTLAGSPYIVTINLVVFQGFTLTIDPGVEVRFDNGMELDMRGKLIAIGTLTDSITFTSNSASPTMGIWGGIRITGLNSPPQSNQVTMTYCKGHYADRFVDMDLAYEGPYIYEHCDFRYNTMVNYDGGDRGVYFTDCDFIQNQVGLKYPQFGGRVLRSRFLNNVYGVDGFSNVDSCYFSGNTGVACSPYGAAVANTIENNFIGVRCYYNSVNDSFIGNHVLFNTIGVEIQTYFNGSIYFHSNQICNNTQFDIKMATSSSANLGNNCWCMAGMPPDPLKVYDGMDDSNLGLVTANPVATVCPPSWMSVDPPPVVYQPYSITSVSPGVFSISSAPDGATYEVYGVNGQLIQSGSVNGSQATMIDLHNEASGMYVVRILSDGGQWTGKLLVEK